LNIGFGRLDHHSLPKATEHFVAFLRTRGTVTGTATWRWQGHAYLVSGTPHRRVTDTGIILIGDAAGLAYPQSGEGIRPAIESGLLAASTIIAAKGHYPREQLEPYERQLDHRFGIRRGRLFSSATIPGVAMSLLPRLLRTKWFTRHVVLDRWFLHRHDPALVLS
jgi:flavin-dependent dehydrogenase